jgi:DNA-binding IclR family transcriptional regulator
MAEIASTGDLMLQVLEVIAEQGPLQTARIAVHLGLNRTVVHRLVNTLHNRGYVIRSDRGYAIGPTVSRLAMRETHRSFATVAQPFMQALALATGETVVLHRRDGESAVVIAQAIDPSRLVRVQHAEGSRHPLTAGASGRVLLAWQPERFIARLTGSDPALVATLAEIRASGIAISEAELQDGVIGMAVPLPGPGVEVAHALALLAPIQRRASFDVYRADLRQAQASIIAAFEEDPA